jgi:hypothetical protein
MSGASDEQRGAARRVRHQRRAYFDFNYVGSDPSPAHAIAHAPHEELHAMFAGLEAADDMLTHDRSDPRAAALAALRAIIDFATTGTAAHHGGEGRFTRSLELLADDLESLPPGEHGEIFPPVRGWGARQKARRHVQALAAYALSLLQKGKKGDGKLALDDAADAVAGVLEAQGFPFGKRRADRAKAVIAWSKDRMAAAAVAEYSKLSDKASPVEIGRDAVANRRGVEGWLTAELERAGYG